MLLLLLAVFAFRALAEMVENWKASVEPVDDPNRYMVVFEWDHKKTDAIVIGKVSGKTSDDPKCSGRAHDIAADGQPYWMPRFFPRAVSSEITALTGIQFASVDWQPCGHKDIKICHGESHYDFHLYYVPESELNSWPTCDIGTTANPRLPVCENSAHPINKAYYGLIDENMPISANISSEDDPTAQVRRTFDFCVDASSAILRSGVHYGDMSETRNEWWTPVTIIGSHDCQMKFFEPMISWKWISGEAKTAVRKSPWPFFQVSDIQYNKKSFEALPDSWSINVSKGCKGNNGEDCHIRLVVEGLRCPAGGCTMQRKCANMKDCRTGWNWQDLRPLTTTTTTVNSTTTVWEEGEAPSSKAEPLVRILTLVIAWPLFACA